MNNSLEIISQVNEFYQQAWDKLIIFGGLIVALFGIALPIFLTFFQNKITRNFETSFKAAFKEEIKNEVIEHLKQEFSENLQALKIQIEAQTSVSQAITWHFGGLSYSDKNDHKNAFLFYIRALELYIEGRDYSNAHIVIDCIKGLIHHLSQEEFNDLRDDRQLKFEELHTIIENLDNQAILSKEFNQLLTSYRKKFGSIS